MSDWKDPDIKLPNKIGEYLVKRISENGDSTWYTVERFEKKQVFERRWSKEFNQHVEILIESTKPMFQENDYSFVIGWKEIE